MIVDNEVDFDHRIKSGQLTTTNGIRILELAKYPDEVILEARKIFSDLKKLTLLPRGKDASTG